VICALSLAAATMSDVLGRLRGLFEFK
jgi:hypothetical protein